MNFVRGSPFVDGKNEDCLSLHDVFLKNAVTLSFLSHEISPFILLVFLTGFLLNSLACLRPHVAWIQRGRGYTLIFRC